MFITVIATIIAALIGFFAPEHLSWNLDSFSPILLTTGITILAGTIFLHSFILTPLANVELKLIPGVMEFVRHSFLSRFGHILLYLFAFLSIISIPFLGLIQNLPHSQWFALGWIILFGLALDILRDNWNHFVNLLNPSYLVQQISHKALSAIQNDQNDVLRSQVDNLAEIGLRATDKSKLGLSMQALQTFPPIVHAFLSSAKSISHTSQDILKENGKTGDETSYMIYYLLHRLETIYDRGLSDGLETVCREMIVVLGKIITYCAQCDLSMVSFPTHFLTKCGLKAQQYNFGDVAELTTSTLLEIAKFIIREIDVSYAELQEPFRAIMNGLDVLAKGAFKKRKESSIKLLVQPLVDLRALFQTEKMAHHRDTPVITKEIDSKIEEYSILAQVVATIPQIPEFEEPPKSPGDNM